MKEFEDKYKGIIYHKISECTLRNARLLEQIKKMDLIDEKEKLPNISITLNNKIVELSKTFKKYNLSMFSQKIEKYGEFNFNFVDSSFVGDAIILDIIRITIKGIEELEKHGQKMDKVVKRRNKQILVLEKTGLIGKFFLLIKGFIMHKSPIDVSPMPEDVDELNSYLLNYKKIDEQLWNYNLPDNIVSSLVEYILEQGYDYLIMPKLLEESINPTLQKLGLSNLIPKLEEELNEKFQERRLSMQRESWKLTPNQKNLIQNMSFEVVDGNSGLKEDKINLGDKGDSSKQSTGR